MAFFFPYSSFLINLLTDQVAWHDNMSNMSTFVFLFIFSKQQIKIDPPLIMLWILSGLFKWDKEPKSLNFFFIMGSNQLKHVQRCFDLGGRNFQIKNTENPCKWLSNCPYSEVLEDDENTLVVKKLASLIRPRWNCDQFCAICSQPEWTIVKKYK